MERTEVSPLFVESPIDYKVLLKKVSAHFRDIPRAYLSLSVESLEGKACVAVRLVGPKRKRKK